MTIKKLTVIKTIILGAGLAVSGLAAADLTGTWALDVQTGQGGGNPSFELVEADGKVSGTYNGMMGSAPINGTVEGNTFKLIITAEMQGQSMEVQYNGSVNEDSNAIEGKMNMGEFMSGTFTGKKQ